MFDIVDVLFIIAIIFIIDYFYRKKSCSGFQNNSYYFQGNENDSMYNGRQLLPYLKNKIADV
jgi:hypothetical protein